MRKKLLSIPKKTKIILSILFCVLVSGGIVSGIVFSGNAPAMKMKLDRIAAKWPDCFAYEEYNEPKFNDDQNRVNQAFNVADFGEQGSNGWFYRYGKANKPNKSKQMEEFDGERYYQAGIDGLEMKKDFVQPGGKEAAILEWRAAQKGSIDLKVTYVKSVNGDKNPSYPDGVTVTIYKGEKLLETHQVNVKVDKEILMETKIKSLAIEKGESVYIVVDAKSNNAYDGGLLYAAVEDENAKKDKAFSDTSRKDNNANFANDFGKQGSNGWYYMYGKDTASSELVSNETKNGYMNDTSPSLEIGKEFIHPAINDKAIIGWKPKTSGEIEIRGSYKKFEQHDGNPDWPDGVNVSIYLNDKKLFEQSVNAPKAGTNKITFREKNIKITSKDQLYFVVDAKNNSSYDGGCFDIAILDRNGLQNEDAVAIDESEIRQNVANVKDDFGSQGNNGWFYQEGYQDEPFSAYNMTNYIKDDKYVDDSYLEIKRDFVNTGASGKSAIIKWKVAQDGQIAIDSSYTKLKNEDKNPSWPDGTRVTIYHNESKLIQQEFEPNVSQEITKSLDVNQVNVKRGDYITMVVNGKDNNAYDGGKYTFAIRNLSGLVGPKEDDVIIDNDSTRTNNASALTDFGKQGNNGWFYQYGYYTNPFFAVNIANYVENEKYVTKDGIEIKKDFITPSTKGKSANVKWKVAQNGQINIFLSYTKLKNEDKNPSWPDGTVVTLMHNGTILKSETFEPDVNKEITKDLSVMKVDVNKGDYITMLVNGKDNTAYDGGLYAFSIEDANIETVEKKNESGVNHANLASDFGEQGQNGWYYLEGKSLESAELLTHKTADGTGYMSTKDNGLEIKKDFVQPGLNRHAMYQWVTAKDGEINILGNYVKFGHQDKNPDWPDGTILKVYKNDEVLFEKNANVLQGDGNNTIIKIDLEKIAVKKGDLVTFAIESKENNAWDGGRLSIQINPFSDNTEGFKTAPDNNANLFLDFGEQGHEGWYYGAGNKSSEFERADYNNGEYSSVMHDSLLLKKDGVHPSADAGAIYRWIVGEKGKINLNGAYYKSKNESKDNNTPDGVHVAVYQNGKLIPKMSYDVPVSTEKENSQKIVKDGLSVNKGDQIDFIITAKENAAWDYGKLEMEITNPEKPEYEPGANNHADLFNDFGEQGNNGWYYGVCDWDGKKFQKLTYDKKNQRYYNNGKPELKKDYVEPGAGLNAAYKWIAAEDGKIKIEGEYIKYPNSVDPNANGVCLRIFQNLVEKQWIGNGINVGGLSKEVKVPVYQELDVKRGDEIIFAVNPEVNDSNDGGKLSIKISPVSPSENPDPPTNEYVPAPDNSANMFEDFGEQGHEGWYYGVCDWDGKNFHKLNYDTENQRYYNNGKPELKKDYVEPGAGLNAAYKWIAAEDGKIKIEGEYIKYPNSEDPKANGVCLRIFQNLAEKQWIGNGINVGGLSAEVKVPIYQELDVKRGDQIMFAVNPEGNDSWDGGKLSIKISPVSPSENPDPPTEEYVPAPDNVANMFEDFGEQGHEGWYYGVCDWDGKNFQKLNYDSGNQRYYNNGKPELKKDFVEPGAGLNAAYKWIAAEDGKIKIEGEYIKYPNSEDPNANGVSLRIFQNLAEKQWIGNGINVGGLSAEVKVPIYQELDVKRGDQIMFAVNPEGNDSWDGGKLSIKISPFE